MLPSITRPDTADFSPMAQPYIDATAATLFEYGYTDLRELLATQCDRLETLLHSVNDEQANQAYAPGKWSLKESIVHMSDTERVFAYRAMRVARGDATPLPGFEQDDYVPESRSNRRTLPDVLGEFNAVRGASVALIDSLDDEALEKVGTASGKRVTVRALCWMITGHVAHHLGITRDRYLPVLVPHA